MVMYNNLDSMQDDEGTEYIYNEVFEEAPLRQEDRLQSSELYDSTDHLELLVDKADSLEPLDNFENNTSTIDASDNLIEDLEEVTNINENEPNNHQIELVNTADVQVCENDGRNTCCDCCRKTNRIILRKLNEILEILNASHYNIKTDNINFSRLGSFPLETVKDVEDFERKLNEDALLMELYKRNIARIGDDNAELAVPNSLKYILTDEVAIRYSWTGQKQTITFSQHKIIDGILGNEQ
ncbi:unnamed protein product [Lasius platythorax]|uniref:DUF4806 domain-containing protein n=1 Tax=Lasius platythorax TaxID=488582 RepID=A0AAV2NP60_9HYME